MHSFIYVPIVEKMSSPWLRLTLLSGSIPFCLLRGHALSIISLSSCILSQLIRTGSLLSIKTYSSPSHFINAFGSIITSTSSASILMTFLDGQVFQDPLKSSLYLVSKFSPPILFKQLFSRPFNGLQVAKANRYIYIFLLLVCYIWHWQCLPFSPFGNFWFMSCHSSTTYIHYRKFINRHKNSRNNYQWPF